MPIDAPLRELPQSQWANTILFRLARALGYEEVVQPDGEITYIVDPDELLIDAMEVIWTFRDLKSQ